MKVLVLGASGMAGHVVSLYLQEKDYQVDTLSAHTKLNTKTHIIDVLDLSQLNNFLDTNTYDVVINCIGVLVKQSEERKDLAAYINTFLPHFLEKHYASTPTKIIHISTDGVFSGKEAPYHETSPHTSETFYGRSKSLGELNNNKDLTFRVSIIGPELNPDGASLFNWFFNQSGVIQGYTSSLWNGITTLELAKAIEASMKQNITGVYHLAAKDILSKFDLLKLLQQVFKKESLTIEPAKGTSMNMSLVSSRKDFDFKIPGYKPMLKELKEWMKNHQELYSHHGKY